MVTVRAARTSVSARLGRSKQDAAVQIEVLFAYGTPTLHPELKPHIPLMWLAVKFNKGNQGRDEIIEEAATGHAGISIKGTRARTMLSKRLAAEHARLFWRNCSRPRHVCGILFRFRVYRV